MIYGVEFLMPPAVAPAVTCAHGTRFADGRFMRLSTFAFLTLPFAVACSASPDPADTTADDVVQGSAICTPESRALAKPNPELYLVFDSQDAAVDHAKGYLPYLGKKPPVLQHDARYTRAEAL